jgi:hypothetical protein
MGEVVVSSHVEIMMSAPLDGSAFSLDRRWTKDIHGDGDM